MQVDEVDGFVVPAPHQRGGQRGTADEARYAMSPLPVPELLPPELCVGVCAVRRTAIVAEEHYERVLPHPLGAEREREIGEHRVHGRHHRADDPPVAVAHVVAAASTARGAPNAHTLGIVPATGAGLRRRVTRVSCRSE